MVKKKADNFIHHELVFPHGRGEHKRHFTDEEETAVTEFVYHMHQAGYGLVEEDVMRVLKDLVLKKNLRETVVSTKLKIKSLTFHYIFHTMLY